MAWIDVTTVENPYMPETLTKHTVNSRHITQITELDEGRSRLYFAAATEKNQVSMTIQESKEYVMKEIRKQEAGIKPPA